jgi:hypothetical protein
MSLEDVVAAYGAAVEEHASTVEAKAAAERDAERIPTLRADARVGVIEADEAERLISGIEDALVEATKAETDAGAVVAVLADRCADAAEMDARAVVEAALARKAPIEARLADLDRGSGSRLAARPRPGRRSRPP